MTRYVLDTSALLTLRADEEGAGQVEDILRKTLSHKNECYVSFISHTELFYIVWQREGREEAYKALTHLKTLPLEKVDPSEELLILAGEWKAIHPLSLADSFLAATAYLKQAILVHKDPEFEALKESVQLLNLPYKKLK